MRTYPLRRYLDRHPEETQTSLGRRAGSSPQKINDLLHRRTRRPSPELAQRIEKATRGEVTAMELLFWRDRQSSRAA